MADEIRATPRSPLFGLFSDIVNVPLDYMSDPRRTQQMQGLASFIRGTNVPSTLQNLAYEPSGRGLFTGAGGLGGTTRMRPEAIEAALTLAPGVGPVARFAGRGAMAAGRAGEQFAERGVPQIMERGGLPAQLAMDLTQGARSQALPPTKYQGQTLFGLPNKIDVGGKIEEFGTDQRLVDLAKELVESKGFVYSPQLKYADVDVNRAKKLADAYEKMENNPNSPRVKKAYDAMIDETMQQYEALRKKGYKFSFMPESGDIYGNPRNAINDIVLNQRLSVFPTEQGFGGPSAAVASQANPLLMRTGEYWDGKPVTANDVFRAVHDVFGHAKYGVGFRAAGEENAFQAHARMYSPKALPAVTSETRGQNSWVNFGPFGDFNRKASPGLTEYAEQKTGLMPDWTFMEGLIE
jgi:hypothetical protein